jgi:ABC-type nitrate/sulfonate/bicarbonate transport system ATPase subunit
VKSPDVLLADEPTGALDEGTRDEIMDLLESFWRDQGLTLIIVTHDSAVARRAERRLHRTRPRRCTHFLQTLKPGTRVLAEGPYGAMTERRRTRHGILLIAGGR